MTGITAISAGGNRTVALKNDGTVWDWGYNRNGELGDGTRINKDDSGKGKRSDWNYGNIRRGFATAALKDDGTSWLGETMPMVN